MLINAIVGFDPAAMFVNSLEHAPGLGAPGSDRRRQWARHRSRAKLDSTHQGGLGDMNGVHDLATDCDDATQTLVTQAVATPQRGFVQPVDRGHQSGDAELGEAVERQSHADPVQAGAAGIRNRAKPLYM